MNKFEMKIEKMRTKLADLQFCYGYNNYKVCELRRKIKLYEKVAGMSNVEVGEQLAHSAGEVQKLKSGYYGQYTSVDQDRKLIKVLTERKKAEKKEEKKNNVNNCGSIIEIGHSIDDNNNGFQC